MLALTRKKDEAIIIDDNIEIKVLEVMGDKVKLGISAPKEISIYREEIYLQVLESNKKAADVPTGALASIKNLFK
nr:carbon storage regulator CsrA [uncultured Cellulosilyticum sp.]